MGFQPAWSHESAGVKPQVVTQHGANPCSEDDVPERKVTALRQEDGQQQRGFALENRTENNGKDAVFGNSRFHGLSILRDGGLSLAQFA